MRPEKLAFGAAHGLHLAFGHGHFGMTGGPPSGLVSRLITGQASGVDPAPYAAGRFG